MDRLLSVDDVDDRDVDDVVRLGLLVHDRPAAMAKALLGSSVGLVIPHPRAASDKVRLQAAVRRTGATPILIEPVGRGLPPPIDAVVDELADADLRVCVAAGHPTGWLSLLDRRSEVPPVFNAGRGPGDPWVVLAGHLATRLSAARRERGAADDYEEALREAMIPTAAAVIALLAGCEVPTRPAPPIDLRTESASHWFG